MSAQPQNMQLLLEAERRGILPADKAALLGEARNRGLIDNPVANFPSRINEMAKGATLGFNDEAVAGVTAMRDAYDKGSLKDIGTTYDQALGLTRAAEADYENRNPIESTILDIGGSIPTSLIGGVPKTLGQAAKMGGIFGGLYGLGTGKDGLESRASSTVKGAGIGATGSGAIAGLGAIASRIPSVSNNAANKISEVVSDRLGRASPQDKAMGLVSEALNADQLTPRSISTRLSNAKQTGLPVTAIDIATKDIGGNRAVGANLEGLADAAANMPGQGASMAGRVASRQQGQHARIGKSLDEALGKGDIYGVNDDILEQIDQHAAPAYEKAFSDEGAIISPKLDRLLSRPASMTAIKDAITKAKNEGVDLGPMDIFEEEKTGALEGFNVRTLDYVKRSLDDMIESSGKNQFGKLTNDGRILAKLKSDILSEVDKHNPDYAFARKTYGDQASRKSAMEMGRDFRSMDREEIAKFWKNSGESERAAFAVGAKRDLQDVIARTRDSGDAVNRLWTQDIRDKLRPMFPDSKSFLNFSKRMELEKRMAIINNRLTRGSQTQSRKTFQDKINSDGTNVSSVIRGITNPQGAAIEGAMQIMSQQLQKRVSKMDSETAHEIMKILLSDDPKKVLAVEQFAKSKGINPDVVIDQASTIPVPFMQKAKEAIKSIPSITIHPKEYYENMRGKQ